MAAAKNLVLVSAVQAAARSTGAAASWVSSGSPVHVADSFLLEMHLLFEIVNRLSAAFYVRYKPGVGAVAHEFPKGPANKKGRPKFEGLDAHGTVLIQICAGTTVEDRFGTSRGVDVSIQLGSASDWPTLTDLLRVYDAKYKESGTAPLTHPEVSEFAKWVEFFNLRTPGTPMPSLGDLDRHSLATNGDFSTESDAALNYLNIAEVRQFFPGTKHDVRP